MTVAGFGFRRGATLASLQDALALAQRSARSALGASPPMTLLATVHDKARAPCLLALAAHLDLPVCAVAPAQMAMAPTLTDSAAVRALRHTGSVAEAAALAAVGPGGVLIRPRSVSPDRLATCALALRAPFQKIT